MAFFIDLIEGRGEITITYVIQIYSFMNVYILMFNLLLFIQKYIRQKFIFH